MRVSLYGSLRRKPKVPLTRCPIVTRTNPNALSVTAAGKYDRRVIMAKAVVTAFRLKSSGRTWRELMRDALRLAWSRAREDMAQHVRIVADRTRRLAAAPIPAPITVRPMQRAVYRRPLAVSGARAFSHNW